MEKLIDIIVPMYNSVDLIEKGLHSIAMQTISDKVTVTLISDGDKQNYEDIINYFSKKLDINYLVLKENMGPGVARQFGIDNSNLPYIIFMDSDDSFGNPFSLEIMLNEKIINKKRSYIAFSFYEIVKENSNITIHKNQSLKNWIFAKIYERDFLIKNNIKFSNIKTNEDYSFNLIIEALCNKEEEPIYINSIVYNWHPNQNSLTRNNPEEYSYKISDIQFVENMLWAFEILKNKEVNKKKLNEKINEVMVMLYYYYMTAIQKKYPNKEEILKLHIIFYNKFFKKLEFSMIYKKYLNIYNNEFENQPINYQEYISFLNSFGEINE